MTSYGRVLMGLSTFLALKTAWACSCAPIEPMALLESDRIVVVEVLKVGRQLGCVRSTAAEVKVNLQVVDAIEGGDAEGEVLSLRTAAGGASCGLADMMEPGQRWLLFLAEGEESLGLCAGHVLLDGQEASEVLEGLEAQIEG